MVGISRIFRVLNAEWFFPFPPVLLVFLEFYPKQTQRVRKINIGVRIIEL